MAHKLCFLLWDSALTLWVIVLQKAATACLTETCSVNGNRDIEKFVPALVSCIANPAEVPECVNKLSATTFVQV